MNSLPEMRVPEKRLPGNRRRHAGAVTCLLAALALGACQSSSSPPAGGPSGAPPERIVTPLPGAETAPVPPAPAAVVPAPGQEPVVISGATVDIPAAMTDGKVRVAALLPLSGGGRDVGRSLLDGAMLALNELADSNFVLLPFDTKGTDQGAAAAIRDAIDSRAELVIGPLFSASVAAAAPVARAAGINMIAFSNNRIVAEPGVFLAGLLPETQIEHVLRYAATRGIRRVGALLPAGAFGDRVDAALRGAAAAYGLEVVRVEVFGDDPAQTARAVRSISDYDRRQRDLKAQIAALKGATDQVSRRTLARLERLETFGPLPFEALVVAASGAKLTEVAAQLGNFDVDTKTVRLLGLASWSAPGTGREPSLVGAWYADAPAAASADFLRNFRAMYERAPHPLAVDAYDVTALAAILASARGADRYAAATLTDGSGFAGAGGLFRFLPGGLPERALEVREITPDGSKLVEPAAKSFAVGTN